MPVWLGRLLPHAGLFLALAATLWWIDHAGYRRAMAERDLRDARMLQAVRTELRTSERQIAEKIGAISGDYEAWRARLAQTGAALTPIIIKETLHDPRLADPAAGLTPGLLDAVNRARAAGACAAAAASGADCALPAAATGAGSVDR